MRWIGVIADFCAATPPHRMRVFRTVSASHAAVFCLLSGFKHRLKDVFRKMPHDWHNHSVAGQVIRLVVVFRELVVVG